MSYLEHFPKYASFVINDLVCDNNFGFSVESQAETSEFDMVIQIDPFIPK